MESLAWSTISVVFLLLPGFLFYTGLRISERFSRADIQQGPVAQLVTAILVASFVHFPLLGFLGTTCADWPFLLCVDYDLLLRGPGGAVAPLTDVVAGSFWPAGAYFLLANGTGVLLGWIWGEFLMRRGRRLAQHVWVHDLDSRKARDRKLRRRADHAYYANVLTRIGDSSERVVYRGDVVDLGIGPNGCINYIVLGEPSRNVFVRDPVSMNSDAWHVVGGEPDASTTDRREAPKRGRRQKQMLYVAGDSIENVVFSRYALPPLDEDVKRQLRVIFDTPLADIGDLDDLTVYLTDPDSEPE